MKGAYAKLIEGQTAHELNDGGSYSESDDDDDEEDIAF
jgi:hypothetical protein